MLLEALPGEASGLVLEGLREASLYGDIEAWAQEVARLEARWFAPLLGALRDGRLDAIELHGADGAVHRVGRAGLRWGWRRPRRLAGFVGT